MATGTRRANTLSSPQLLWLYGRSRRRAPGGWRRRSAGAGGTFSPLPPRPCSQAARGRTARARGTLRCTSAYARTWRGCLYSLRTPRSGSATGCSARTYSQTLRRRWNKQPDIDPCCNTKSAARPVLQHALFDSEISLKYGIPAEPRSEPRHARVFPLPRRAALAAPVAGRARGARRAAAARAQAPHRRRPHEMDRRGTRHLPPQRPAPARRERPAARAPGRARPAGQRVRQGRGIKVFGVIYARRAATSPSTAAPAIRVHLMRPPARRQAWAALPRAGYTARHIRRRHAFKAEQRRYNHSAQPAILRRRNPAPCCNTPKFSTETVLQHGAAAAAAIHVDATHERCGAARDQRDWRARKASRPSSSAPTSWCASSRRRRCSSTASWRRSAPRSRSAATGSSRAAAPPPWGAAGGAGGAAPPGRPPLQRRGGGLARVRDRPRALRGRPRLRLRARHLY